VYLPFAVRTAGFSEEFLSTFLQSVLQDSMAFETYIAFALAMQSIGRGIDARKSKAILHHSAKGMSALRKKLLLGTNAIGDMVIFTMVVLCAVNVRTYFPLR